MTVHSNDSGVCLVMVCIFLFLIILFKLYLNFKQICNGLKRITLRKNNKQQNIFPELIFENNEILGDFMEFLKYLRN